MTGWGMAYRGFSRRRGRGPDAGPRESTMTLDSRFAPGEIEPRLYEGWENAGSFACDPNSNAAPFTIMIPPPNVRGSLHSGHAVTMSIQDTLGRWRRMQGRDALWQPGPDHAGIATQMMVERLLADEGKDR